MNVSMVPVGMLDTAWPQASAFLDKALSITPGRWDIPSLKKAILNLEQALWVVFNDAFEIKAAFTTRTYDLPLGRVCAIEWVGGENLEEWIDSAINILESYAKDMSCTVIEGHGRAGWKNILDKHGWSQFSVSYQKIFDK